jgi:hypothetical protein
MRSLRHLIIRAARPRFSGSFLPYPLRVAGAALALTVLLGCARFTPAYKVATIENDYNFRLARYKETCPPAPATAPAWCGAYEKQLVNFKKHIQEAGLALKAGGGLPLQVKQVKADDAAVKKATPK